MGHIFKKWCAAQNPPIVPEGISAPDLADFFVYLTDERHLSHSTITGYRTVIDSVLKLYKNKASKDQVISQIIHSVK